MPRKKRKSASGMAGVIRKYARSSGFSPSTLRKVYKRGLGAYYSSGSRPGVTAHQELDLLQLVVVVQEKQIKIY